MWELLFYTVTAGIAGTALGGFVGILFKGARPRPMSCVLSFAGGIMVSLVCFELIPESIENGSLLVAAVSLLAGMLVILLLNRLIERRGGHAHGCGCHCGAPGCGAPDGAEGVGNRTLLRAGLMMIAALAVHNLPEGFAIGAGMAGGKSAEFGLRVALLIALHNIPDGMAISVSLTAGGMNRWRALGLTALSGVPTVLGGLLGWWLGGISPTVVAVALAAAGGALLYVTFCEILPESNRMGEGRSPAVFVLLGLLLGMVVSGLAL